MKNMNLNKTVRQNHRLLCDRLKERNGIALIFQVIAAFILSLYSAFKDDCKFLKSPVVYWCIYIISVLFLVSVAIQIYVLICTRKTTVSYKKEEEKNRIHSLILTSFKQIEQSKTNYILQATYGDVPIWHPTNYVENVLAYDVHSHLRTICIHLKMLILQLRPEIKPDNVTVDMAYCYPYDEELLSRKRGVPRCPRERNNKRNDDYHWKIITSGEHPSTNSKLHEYLYDRNSFYEFLDDKVYSFFNDKEDAIKQGAYTPSSRDKDCDSNGSIAGMTIELKNDQPEKVFVRMYLTITTYGRKLVEEGDTLDIKEFKEFFKEEVLYSYKALIESELAQMFIRHAIRERYIYSGTGGFIKP